MVKFDTIVKNFKSNITIPETTNAELIREYQSIFEKNQYDNENNIFTIYKQFDMEFLDVTTMTENVNANIPEGPEGPEGMLNSELIRNANSLIKKNNELLEKEGFPIFTPQEGGIWGFNNKCDTIYESFIKNRFEKIKRELNAISIEDINKNHQHKHSPYIYEMLKCIYKIKIEIVLFVIQTFTDPNKEEEEEVRVEPLKSIENNYTASMKIIKKYSSERSKRMKSIYKKTQEAVKEISNRRQPSRSLPPIKSIKPKEEVRSHTAPPHPQERRGSSTPPPPPLQLPSISGTKVIQPRYNPNLFTTPPTPPTPPLRSRPSDSVSISSIEE